MKKKYGLIIKSAISIAFILLVLRKMDFHRLSGIWGRLNLWYFGGAYLILLTSIVINSIKWHHLLKIQGVKISLWKVINLYLVGYFFNNFFTGMGEVKRIYDMSKITGESFKIIASVFMERWTGIIVQISSAIVVLIWAYKDISGLHTILIICGTLFISMLAIFLLMGVASKIPFIDRIEKLHLWLEMFRKAHNQYTQNHQSLALAFLLSIPIPIILILVHWLLIKGLGYSGNFWTFVIFIPIISVFSQVPITINGIGVQEILFVELLGMAGIPPEASFSVSILSHLLKMGIGIIGGITYIKSHTS